MDDHNRSRFAKLLLFALAYSGMVGGMATPSGGGRNPLMIEYLYRLAGIKVSYMQWVVMALPVAVVLLPVLYFILRGTFRLKTKEFTIDKDDSVGDKFADISGRLSPKEKLTAGIFLFILSLWIFASDKLGMGIIALFGVFLYLIFGLAKWRDISSKTNWGIILIYASALSLGLAMKHTGVTEWFANVITDTLYNLNIGYKPAVLVSIGAISSLMSDVLSHGPSVAVSGPIFLKLAEVMRMNVLVVGLINAMTASFGFLTVIAAPTNSLIFTSGFIKTSDYIKAGWFATIAAVIVTTVFSLLYWNILGYNL
jgi:sodium-dependent dicarboxylate transporter 2/3/5